MFDPEIYRSIQTELAQAENARANNNEGQARVCARRAAGVAIRAFLSAHRRPVLSTSAVDLISQIQTEPGLPEAVQQVAAHLLVRVTPDFALPVPVDLIAETRWLVDTLESHLPPPGS